MDASTFKVIFPEFTETSDPAIDFWLGLAGVQLNVDRWSNLLDQGTALFVAHHLAISARDLAVASSGGIGGEVKGPLTQKSVDKVSASYDASSATYADAGFWNMTTYGLQYWNLLLMVGAGGIQL